MGHSSGRSHFLEYLIKLADKNKFTTHIVRKRLKTIWERFQRFPFAKDEANQFLTMSPCGPWVPGGPASPTNPCKKINRNGNYKYSFGNFSLLVKQLTWNY